MCFKLKILICINRNIILICRDKIDSDISMFTLKNINYFISLLCCVLTLLFDVYPQGDQQAKKVF